MNNIVKIILGLNIAAGGAGIFFGITKSGKVEEMKMANQVPALLRQIAAYENLGTPENIKTMLDRLAKLEAATAPAPNKNVPKKTKAGKVGTIQTHDPQLHFYVIDAGADDGIKKGDTFAIFRNGKAIGKIEISRLQATVSIGVYQKGFLKPTAPFKIGDEVMKIK